MNTSLIEDGVLRLERIKALCRRPPLFEPAEHFIWDDPHIATQMLAAHLDPDTDAASRRPEIIDATVEWLVEALDLKPGDPLLDLGCGPGLYCKRLAARGLKVTGVDLSENSIRYADAHRHDPATEYICQNYLTLDYTEAFKTITLIYGDFCVLSDQDRDKLLDIVHRALQPGGHFVFDVTTRRHHDARRAAPPTWSVHDGAGFWKPGPHMTLAQVFDYPAHDTMLEQYIVIEADGTISAYRNWFHYYSAETVTAALEVRGFAVRGLYSDLTGAPYAPDSEWIGVVARMV